MRLQRRQNLCGAPRLAGDAQGPTTIWPFLQHVSRGGAGTGEVQLRKNARVILEKPLARPVSARKLNDTLHQAFPEENIFVSIIIWARRRWKPSDLPLRQQLSGTHLEPQLRTCVQITMAESFGVEGRGKFYEEAVHSGCGAEPHVAGCSILGDGAAHNHVRDSVRDEQVKIFRTIPH